MNDVFGFRDLLIDDKEVFVIVKKFIKKDKMFFSLEKVVKKF